MEKGQRLKALSHILLKYILHAHMETVGEIIAFMHLEFWTTDLQLPIKEEEVRNWPLVKKYLSGS